MNVEMTPFFPKTFQSCFFDQKMTFKFEFPTWLITFQDQSTNIIITLILLPLVHYIRFKNL